MNHPSGLASVAAALPIAVPLLALLVLAAREDLRTRRISNGLIVLGLILGIVVRFAVEGRAGLLSAATGALFAGGLLYPGLWLGWTGAGDVKLMAVSGAWLGPIPGGMAALFSLVAALVMALAIRARQGAPLRLPSGPAALTAWFVMQPGAGPTLPTGLRFPFTLAILAGTFVALWVQV
jgi:prepilin peptidase CpaA